jgi:hypothetical protein
MDLLGLYQTGITGAEHIQRAKCKHMCTSILKVKGQLSHTLKNSYQSQKINLRGAIEKEAKKMFGRWAIFWLQLWNISLPQDVCP